MLISGRHMSAVSRMKMIPKLKNCAIRKPRLIPSAPSGLPASSAANAAGTTLSRASRDRAMIHRFFIVSLLLLLCVIPAAGAPPLVKPTSPGPNGVDERLEVQRPDNQAPLEHHRNS